MFTVEDIKRIREGSEKKFTASDVKAIRESSYKKNEGTATRAVPSVSTPKTGYEIPAFNNYMENVTLPKMKQQETMAKARASLADGTLSKPSTQPIGQMSVREAAQRAEANKTLSPATYAYTLRQRALDESRSNLENSIQKEKRLLREARANRAAVADRGAAAVLAANHQVDQFVNRVGNLEIERDWTPYINDQNSVGFLGRFESNLDLGRLTQDKNAAWNEYYENPTELNRRKAESLSQTIETYVENNAEALAGKGLISRSLAGYLPQFKDQTFARIGGGLAGSLIGAPKTGAALASGAYSLRQMRGAAYESLINAGVPEEIARKAAQDEGILSAMIEMADTGMDIFTFGALGGKTLLNNLLRGGTSALARTGASEASQSAAKKLLKGLGAYGLNIVGEGAQEASQEVVSIANQERALSGGTGLKNLAGQSVNKALNLSEQGKAQVWDSAKEGMKIAAMMGAATKVGTSVINRGFNSYNDNLPAQQNPASQPVQQPSDENILRRQVDDYIADSVSKSRFVENPVITDEKKPNLSLGKVAESLTQEIRKTYGQDISGREHVLNDNDIRHIYNRHGPHTKEKYPITVDDLRKIPDIITQYDEVYYVERKDGKSGIVYEKRHNGVTYYLEQVMPDSKTLQNKQMIKTSTGTIPDIQGLKEAIIKKRSAFPAPDDAAKAVPRMYAHDVKENASSQTIPQNQQQSNAIKFDPFAEGAQQNTFSQPLQAPSGETSPVSKAITNKPVDGPSEMRYNGNTTEVGGAVDDGSEVYSRRGRMGNSKVDPEGNVGRGPETVRGVSEDGRKVELRTGDHREISSLDSEGKRIEPETAKRLYDSAVVDDNNRPTPVYHFTEDKNFETFAKGDIGFHFGSQEQASERQRGLRAKDGRTLRVYLDIKNPIHAGADTMNWNSHATAMNLAGLGYLSEAELIEINKLALQGQEYDSPASVRLREILAAKGYDGIVYDNKYEGEGKSYIAFYPEQIITTEIGNSGDKGESLKKPINKGPESQATKSEETTKESQWQAKLAGEKRDTKRLSDIVAKIRHDWSVPVVTGRVTDKSAAGQYRPKIKGIRTRIANDLPTIAHELGHHLDNLYSLTKNLSDQAKSELINGMDEEFRALYKPNELPSEGLAEFVRRYLQNKEEASAAYPRFIPYLKERLGEEGLKTLDTLADDVNAYYALDSETAASSIRRAGEKGEDFRTPMEKLRDMGDRFYQAFTDPNHEIKRFEEATGAEVYKAATNSAYSDARAMAVLTGDLYNLKGERVGDGLRKATEPIAKILKTDEGYDAFNEYLVVRHGPERLREGMRIFADERKNNAQWMERRAAELEKEYPKFKETADNLYKFQREFLYTWGVDTGLISKETADSWGERWEYYAPLNRAMDDGKGAAGARRGFANQNSTIHKARGSGRDIIAPLDNIINNIVRMVNAGTRNDVMLRITKAAKKNPGTAIFLEKVPTPTKETKVDISGVKERVRENVAQIGAFEGDIEEIFAGIDDALSQYSKGKEARDEVTVLNKGKRETWKVNDPQLLNSIANMSPSTADTVLETLGRANRFMQSNITGNNVIWSLFSNAPRDLMTAITYWPYEKDKNLGHLFTGIASAYKNKIKQARGKEADPLFLEYQAMGGGMTSAYTADKNLTRNIQKKLSGDSATKYINPLETLDFVSNTIELGPRYATYRALRNKGFSPEEAFYASNDITTNFRRGGQISRQINKGVPFFNAGVQGLDHFARWVTAADAIKGDRKKVAMCRASAWVGVSAALALLMWGLNGQDDEAKEDYAQLSNFVKNSYFNFPLGDGRYFAIPKPRELGTMSSLFESALEKLANKNERAFDDFGEYLANQWLPNGVGDLARGDWQGALGSLGVLGVGSYVMANRDFLGRPIVSNSMEKMENRDQYTRRTSQIAYWAGRAFNLSPQKLDYVGENLLGGWWKAQKALFPIGAENWDLTLGVQNTYIKDNQYSNDVINRLYDGRDAAEKKKNSNPGDMDKAITYKNYNNMATFYSRYNQIAKNVVDRETRQVVLNTVMEFEKSVESGKKTEARKVVEDLCVKLGETDLMPSVVQTVIKDDNKKEHALAPDEYVAYQLDYLSRYWEYLEAALEQSGNRKTAYLEALVTTIKERAAEDAKTAALRHRGVYSQAQTDSKGMEKEGLSLEDQIVVKTLIRSAGTNARKEEQLKAIEKGMEVSEERAKELWAIVKSYKYSADDLDEDATTRYEYAKRHYNYSEEEFLRIYNGLKLAESQKRKDRIKALTNLGYSYDDARKAVDNVFDKPLKEMRK